MTKERYERFKILANKLHVCHLLMFLLNLDEQKDKGELSDILDSMLKDLGLIIDELEQRLEFIEILSNDETEND